MSLPELKNNLIEGVVIKPFNQLNDESVLSRPIVKLKNPEFDEEKKFHQAEKWTFIPRNISTKTEDLSYVLVELRTYITPNRLESAISKIGALDFTNEQRIIEIKSEFFNDILVDFNENNDSFLEELSEEEKTWLNERIKAEINEFVLRGKAGFS